MMTQGNLLARYSIVHELGRGATGAVYAARDRETGAIVALKRFDPALLGKSDAGLAGRVLKHARSARLLKHPNIVGIHDAGESGGTIYVVMEMLEGQDLRKLLDAGPLPLARAMQIARDIASGLAHAHLEGVVHGALKPSNVIVLGSGAVKITDFGTGQAAPPYMPPERLRSGLGDHRCDVFSLGALFYEMLAHRPPIDGASPPPPSELNPHVPRALDAVVLSMLARDPASRMPGAPILLRELQRIEEGLGLDSGAPAAAENPSAEPSAPNEFEHGERITDREAYEYHKVMDIIERESRRQQPRRSRPAMFAAALVLAGLAVGSAGFIYSHYSSQPDIAASRVYEAPAIAPAPSQPAAPAPVAEATEEKAEPAPVARIESVVAPRPEQPAAAEPAPVKEVAPATPPAAKGPAPQPDSTAQVIVAVSPRGEIYVNGKHHGTTPPITALRLEPGMHRIEVRNGSRKPYLTYMTVQAGDVRRIRHDFNAIRASPGR